MLVRELIAALRKFDGELLVVMSKDEEGNRFSPLGQVTDGRYASWGDSDQGDFSDGEIEENGDLVKPEVNSVCFWPRN